MDSANVLEVKGATSNTHKTCTKCGEKKPKSEFSFRNKAKGILQARCKQCFREYAKAHYNDNRDKYVATAKRTKKRLIKRKMDYVYDLLSVTPCSCCGFSDPRALQFDHVDPKDKVANIADMVSGRYNSASLPKLKTEIEKCVVLCANCHAIKTAEVSNNWKNKRDVA